MNFSCGLKEKKKNTVVTQKNVGVTKKKSGAREEAEFKNYQFTVLEGVGKLV